MMKPRTYILSLLLLLFIQPTAHAQVDSTITDWDEYFAQKYSVESAKKALHEGTAELLIVGGISPIVYIGQERFKKKYGVGYNDFGCLPECSNQEMKLYNYTIFNWLNEKYGKKWQKSVRKDVVGFEKWALYQDAVPYLLCDSKPSFNGGTNIDFNLWVINHMKVEQKHKVSGMVCVNVLLSEDGRVIDVDDIGRLDYSPLTKAYIKAIMEAPQWTPAFHDGKPCKVKVSIVSNIDYR